MNQETGRQNIRFLPTQVTGDEEEDAPREAKTSRRLARSVHPVLEPSGRLAFGDPTPGPERLMVGTPSHVFRDVSALIPGGICHGKAEADPPLSLTLPRFPCPLHKTALRWAADSYSWKCIGLRSGMKWKAGEGYRLTRMTMKSCERADLRPILDRHGFFWSPQWHERLAIARLAHFGKS